MYEEIEQKKIWIEALRSGKYNQTTLKLQDNDGYCCLGVACKILIPKNDQFLDFENNLKGDAPYDQNCSPIWLKKINDTFYDKNGVGLANLNDFLGYSFNDLADLIEADINNDEIKILDTFLRKELESQNKV